MLRYNWFDASMAADKPDKCTVYLSAEIDCPL